MTLRVLGLCGSLSTRSQNSMLLDRVMQRAPNGATLTLWSRLAELPPFEPERADQPPPIVRELAEAIGSSDALCIASPEYGFSLPGSLKNAIDWAIGGGQLEGKVVALTAAVRTRERGRRGLSSLATPLHAVSAKLVFARPIVVDETLESSVDVLWRALIDGVAEARDGRAPEVGLWFDFASTYSYPALMRAPDLARRWGVRLVLRPFLLGPIFGNQGWNDSPFNIYPAKGAYMWRDLERECARASPVLPFRRPSVFPRNGMLAARVAIAHAEEPWLERFVQSVFTTNFAEDRDIADRAVLSDLLTQIDVDPTTAFATAESPEHKPKLREQTARAQALGIFGAPSFVTRGELFWGNDRLEHALDFARLGHGMV